MKKSKIITIVLSVVLALVAIAGGALLAINRLQSQKTGNKANVAWYDETLDEFTISTVDELYDLVALSNFYDFEGQTILLDADLVLNEGDAAEWAETAPGNRWTPIRGFAGTFDGQGHTISGMYGRGIDVSMGLFTDTTSKSKVKDLKIVNSYFEADGDYPVGSISANGSGTFEKIYSNAIVVTNGERSGGIIGEVNPVQENSVMTQQTRISNCWFDGELRMETERGMYGGGIAGKLTSGTTMIEHCLNSAPVSCESTYSGGSHVGGICGALRFNNYTGNLTIRDCLNVGEVKTQILTCVGSIIGRSFGQTQMVVENTYATVESGENVWHFLEGKCNGEPTQIEQKYLLGNGGFEWTDLDFNTYWTIVNEGTPILQAFATEIPSVAGLKKAYNLDWYDSTKKEFTLNSLEDLRGFAMLAKRNDFAKRTIKLGADIVMNEGDASTWGKNPPAYKWTPIGWTEADTSFKKFAGTFDGQGHTISGMYVNTDTGAAGLFGNVVDATIKNLKITNSYIESSVEGWAMAGSVAGLGYGVFDTIYSDAIIVSAGEYVGGIFGMMNESAKPEGSKFVSKMTNCWFDGELRLVGEKATKGGGILGGVMKAQCSVEHCLNTGKISSEIKPGDDDTKVTDDPIVSLGGIVGYIGGKDDALTIKDCLGVGKIVPKGSDRGVGSVLGFQNNGTMIVENAYGSDEAYKTTGAATMSGGNGFFRVPEKDLLGVNGYANTMLDFYLAKKNADGYWVAVKNGTPVLKSFAGSSLNLNGVARRINTDWYDAKKSTYEIKTLAELRGFRELLKNIDFNDKTIKLTADIVVNTGDAATWGTTAPAEEWIPMGWTEEHPEYKKFSGTFDGQGHTVSGLYVSTDKGAAGFFGNVVDCTIKNLKIKNSYIESKLADGWAMVGSVAGLGYGVLDTIYSDAIIVSHGEYSGGMFGMMNESAKPEDSKFESKIVNCWFDGELQLKGEKATKGGGILGGVYSAECSVAHCLNTGVASSEISPGNDDKKTSDDPIVSLGGIVGYINGKKDALTIEDCLGAGKMAPKGSNRGVGSVLGFQNNGTMVVNNAYAVEESWSTTGGATLSGGNGFFRIPEKNLLGLDGYANTMLNFYVTNTNPSGYWAAVSNATPVLKSFAGNALDLSGVARRINTDWYDKDKDVYEISSLAELLGFAELLKNTNFKGKTVKLTANITLNTGDAKDWATTAPANSWTPMGWNGAHNEYQKFAGTFDGQFHEISGIYVKEAMEGIGLFGNLDNATIKNLKLVNSYFESTLTSGWGMVGSIAGLGYGTFDSIYSDAIVANSANYTGGLVGKLTAAKAGITATFTNCWFAGEVQMKGQNGIKGGGLVGAVEGVNDSDKDTICKIKHCLNTGTISSEAGSNALISLGGFVGHMHYKTDKVSLDDCLNVGTINPKDSTRGAGSIIGFVNNGTFTAERTYGMTESYGSLGAYTITADTKIDKIDRNNLKGLMGYMNTLLDFYIKDENEGGYWEAMKDDVPQLRTFAKGEVDDLTGASRAMNTDWYYGHESDTEYVLYTLGDLRGFSEIAKTYNFAGKTVKLGADIEYNKGTDVSAWKNVWTPIGATDSNYKYQKFAGTFDGQGHSVSGIYVTTSDGAVGFFGNVDGATIKNFKLLNSYIESTRSKDGEWGMVGSIAGCGYGTFESIYSNATVKCGARYVGGMVVKATAPSDGKSAIFKNCQFAGEVEADGAGAIDIAGFVGAAERITLKIQHCLTSGTVVNKSTRSGNLRVAGFMGYANNATVVMEDSLSVGNVSYTRSANDVTTGSIVGWDCSGTNTYQYVYTTEECCAIVGAMDNPSRITRLPKAQLRGTDGYKNSFLNFYRPVTNETGYWVAVEGSTPELKTFATSSMSLDGVERPYDISWYDSSVKTHEIADAEDFRGFIELAKNNNFSGHTVKLTGDIVLNTSDAKTWGTTAPTYEMTPIGKSGENTGYAAFAGTFDGQGHSISGVYMKSDKGMLGLFGETEICTIKNFKLLNSYIESTYAADPGMVGSVAGKASGLIEAVYSDAIVISGCTYSGGIVGMAEGKNGGNKLLTISNCQFAGELHMKGAKGIYAGGILGGTYGNTTIVQHCLNTGQLDNEITSGNGFLAGLVGYSRSGAITVNDCVNVGTVTSSVTSTVGSIFGWDMNGKCTITNTYALTTSHSRLGDFTVTSTVKKMTAEELNSAELEWYNAGAETGYWVKVEGSTPILKTFEPASTTQVAQNTSLFSVLRGFWKALTK